jgi:hypothetical protein
MPSARGRSSFGNTVETMARARPRTAAPAQALQDASGDQALSDEAATAEPAAHAAMPGRNIRRRPRMSPSPPALTTKAARTNR